MFVQRNSFKPFKDLSKEELKEMYNRGILLTLLMNRNGYPKPNVIAENISDITKVTGLEPKQVRTTYEHMQNDVNELAFGGNPIPKIGFKQG